MDIQLFHAPLSCSLASRLALTAAGVRHEVKIVNTQRGENTAPAYLKINPAGKVPALRVDGVVLTESTAILPFIASLKPGAALMPTGPLAQAQAQAVLSFTSSTVHAAWTAALRPERFSTGAHVEAVREAAIRRLGEGFAPLETTLASRSYLLGDRTVCDLYLAVFLVWRGAAPFIQGRLPPTPGLDALQARVFADPALGAALRDDLAVRSAG